MSKKFIAICGINKSGIKEIDKQLRDHGVPNGRISPAFQNRETLNWYIDRFQWVLGEGNHDIDGGIENEDTADEQCYWLYDENKYLDVEERKDEHSNPFYLSLSLSCFELDTTPWEEKL